VRDQQRHFQGAQDVIVVDLARREMGADLRRDGDVPAHRRLEVVGRDRLHQAGPDEGTHAPEQPHVITVI
jgi:hypothetical protein